MKSNVQYGIWHPTKGLLGFSAGEPIYPNEHDPKGIAALETSLASKDIQDDKLAKSGLLLREECVVVPVYTLTLIGNPQGEKYPIKVGSGDGADYYYDGNHFYSTASMPERL